MVIRQAGFAFQSQFQRFSQQRCLLVRRLSARRHHPVCAGLRACRAVTKGENIVIAGGLQGRAHHQLVDAVGFQPGNVFQKARCTNAGGPYLQACRNDLAVFGDQAIGRHFAHG